MEFNVKKAREALLEQRVSKVTTEVVDGKPTDSVTAALWDGVLNIRVPKAGPPRDTSRRINFSQHLD